MSDQQTTDLSYYMHKLVDQVPSMLAYWDKDLRCRFANKAYKVWFGLTPEQLIGIRMQDLLGPKLFALNEPYIRAALAGQEQQFERIVPGPDGVQRHSLASYLPDVVHGEVQGFLVQVTEVTKLKEAEAALRASEAFLDRTGQLANVGGWEVDLRTNALKWSEQVSRIYDLPPGYQPTREEARQFVDPEARERLSALVASGTQSGKPWEVEFPIISAKGRRAWLRSFCEIEFKDGVPVRMFGAVQDITEQRTKEAELQQEQSLRRRIEQQVDELDRLLKERSEMLTVLAHEVRQPLNNASAALQSAKSSLSSLNDQTATQRVERAQKVMNQVMANIDNTLAVAALLAQSTTILRQDTDIDTLIGVVIADMPADERHRIQIQRQTATRTASMDMSLMRLALRNLLANALKFSPPGEMVGIRISDSDTPLALIIDVEDHGPGVAAEVRPHLFERGAHARQQPQTGHGLGLYIVRRVMELHGGSVSLVEPAAEDSNAPQGTTMRLIIIQAPGSQD